MRLFSLLIFLTLGGCQQVTNPDGSIGLRLAGGGQPAQSLTGQSNMDAANNPYVQQVVPDRAVFQAQRTVSDSGAAGAASTLRRCEANARANRRDDYAACWALDLYAVALDTAMVNTRRTRPIAGLDRVTSQRRMQLYARQLHVGSDRYQLVEDGTFQRVMAVMTTGGRG